MAAWSARTFGAEAPSRRRARVSALPATALLGMAACWLLRERLPFSVGFVSAPGGAEPAPRREAVLQLSSALAGAASFAAAGPAEAEVVIIKTNEDQQIQVPAVDRQGFPSYFFFHPKNFQRYSNPVDPTAYILRKVNNPTLSFVARAENRPNCGNDFNPKVFIADYTNKFSNITGSTFTLIRGGGEPDRVDPDLNVKYYEVEYVVRTQMGLTFDSLKTLHFVTCFGVGNNSLVILNTQASDDTWDKDGPILRKVLDSFRITSQV